MLVAKAGVRNDRDLVRSGPAANYAAKLNTFNGFDADYPVSATVRLVSMAGLDYFTKRSGGAKIREGPFMNFDQAPHYRTCCDFDI